jgi:hypothetical protein
MDKKSEQILEEVFAILGLSEEEKERMRFLFNKRIAFDLLRKIESELPEEYQMFINSEAAHITDPAHPMVLKIAEYAEHLHTREEYETMTKDILRKLLPEYVSHASDGLNTDITVRLEECIKKIN